MTQSLEVFGPEVTWSTWTLQLQRPADGWTTVVLCLVVLIGAAMYGTRLGIARRSIAMVLGALGLGAVVLSASAQMVLVRSGQRVARSRIHVLLDDSWSMNRPSDRTLRSSRLGVAALIEDRLRDRFGDRAEIVVHTLSGAPAVRPVSAQGRRTAIFDRIREVADAARAGDAIVVLTDGDSFDDVQDPATTALGLRGIPVLGFACATEPLDDIRIEAAHTPAHARHDSRVRVSCQIAQSGFDGETVEVTVHSGWHKVAQTRAVLDAARIRVELEVPVGKEGLRTWMFTVNGPEDDVPGNGCAYAHTRVTSTDVGVLVLGAFPGWDWRLTSHALLKVRDLHDVTRVDRALLPLNNHAPPLTVELEEYDQVFVVGFELSDFSRIESQLVRFIREGGSLCVLGSPTASRGASQLLPVRGKGTQRPGRLQLGPGGRSRRAIRVPVFLGIERREQAEPLADAFVGETTVPGMVYRRHGALGRCLWVGTTALWQARAQYDPEAADRVVMELSRFLVHRAREELLVDGIHVDRSLTETGQLVAIRGKPGGVVEVLAPDGTGQRLELRSVQQIDRVRVGLAVWRPGKPGRHRLRVVGTSIETEVMVHDASRETLRDLPDRRFLAEFCRATGGEMLHDPESLADAVGATLGASERRVRVEERIDMRTPCALLGVLILLISIAAAGTGTRAPAQRP